MNTPEYDRPLRVQYMQNGRVYTVYGKLGFSDCGPIVYPLKGWSYDPIAFSLALTWKYVDDSIKEYYK